MLSKTLRNNTFFYIPYLILLLALIPILILYPKPDIHLYINRLNSDFSDWLFRHITFLGDGLFIIVPALVLLFFSLRHFVFLVVSYFSTGLFAQILKRVFFEDVARPSRYFEDTASLHLVNGVELLGGRSFPSGHATSAFALFLCFALISPNRYIKLACFVLACLVAFSRVYLSQHFLIDIIAGSLIGTLGATGFYLVFYHDERKWYAWTIQNLFRNDVSKA